MIENPFKRGRGRPKKVVEEVVVVSVPKPDIDDKYTIEHHKGYTVFKNGSKVYHNVSKANAERFVANRLAVEAGKVGKHA
jgi:hypothetical protein